MLIANHSDFCVFPCRGPWSTVVSNTCLQAGSTSISHPGRLYVVAQLTQYSSRHIRKPTICTCENKDADHLCSNCTADQHLCFHSKDTYNPSFLFFYSCTAWFVSDQVRNGDCWFSHAKTHRLYCMIIMHG